MPVGDISPLKAIQALQSIGWYEVAHESDEAGLVLLDTDEWETTLPIIIDTSQPLVPFEADLLPQLEQAGVDINAFMAAFEAI